MKKQLFISIAMVLSSVTIPNVQASPLTVTATIGGTPSVAGATLETFNAASPSILTLSGSAYLVTGGRGFPDYYTAPYFSGSTAAYFGESPANGYDDSQFVAVISGGSATLSFVTPEKYLGLLWGSVDKSYNTLTFYDSANNVIDTVPGSALSGVSDEDGGPNGTAYVNITSTIAFSKVVVNTSGSPGFFSFEFDDVAYAPVVPEPASVVLLGAGLCIFGFRCRRKFA
ncbi:MAG TPA: PEP-CTERM sorting domain-containing protein [Candidatus Acidoferrum sp.]|nr:PEP-CTERM sorting domain-containing protein [Candidatus Acidoferrum sp.]